MKNQLTLLHFENPEELLSGIDTLQQHHIIIREICASGPMPGIAAKLRIKQLRFGQAVFRFGCLGGIALTSLGYYVLQPQVNNLNLMLNALMLLVTLLVAGRFFSVRAPKLTTLKPGDRRCFAVVDTQRLPANQSIAHLFQYTAAVEISPAVKNIVIP